MDPQDMIRELATELGRLIEQRDSLNDRIAMFQGVMKVYMEKEQEESRAASDSRQLTEARLLRDALHNYLSLTGRPMNRRELLQYVVDMGIHVNGENPLNNIGAHMSNDARFESLGEGMWGLREWTHAPVGINESLDATDLPF